MVVKLPAIPGARGETLLAKVYFPVGSETAERTQILSLLSSIANYAVKHKANIVAADDWNAVTPGNPRSGYTNATPRHDADLATAPVGKPGQECFWRFTAV